MNAHLHSLVRKSFPYQFYQTFHYSNAIEPAVRVATYAKVVRCWHVGPTNTLNHLTKYSLWISCSSRVTIEQLQNIVTFDHGRAIALVSLMLQFPGQRRGLCSGANESMPLCDANVSFSDWIMQTSAVFNPSFQHSRLLLCLQLCAMVSAFHDFSFRSLAVCRYW